MSKILSAEEEFLKAFETIEPIEWVEEYRAYYNHEGWVTGFAGSGFPDGDNWVTIDKELYQSDKWRYLRLVNGKLERQEPKIEYSFPLTPSDKGVKVVKYHASVVVEPYEEYSEVEYYERRNS